ncbi:LamG-like jellyroll fold domain-containing protein [Frigoribacterium sp. PhB24]|uniref:LamG-like jellyroll fold domain-containing protein n=1 Tax=Frigoribacterium sp. PhB24 TaxID=2485204 RepID=UPI000F48FF15|nr:LamG-like jellyroll fold domain-containing protein [Frigoribacterium sp. PhB24]ROS57844.1 concanavalin A-like lectin/glucanase superfamily protein [Frigoribacterium sp. PhB24]
MTTVATSPVAASPQVRSDLSFWGALCLATVARVVLTTAVCLLLWAAVPALWGWSPTTVVSGSMAPAIAAGDVVVAMPVDVDDLDAGQVLLVDDPDRAGALRLHRLVDTTDEGLRLRGDANADVDSSLVSTEAVRGVGVLLVPAIGSAMLWQGGDRVLGVLVVSLVVLLLLAATRLEPTSDDVVDPLALSRHRARTPPTGRTRVARAAGAVLAVVAGVAVLFVVVGSSHAAFSATTSTRATLATSRFACLDRPVAAQARFAYQFNDGVGTTARDASGNGRAGTLTQGATIRSGTCAAGASPYARFDGATGQVTTAQMIDGPQVFTVETWFRTTTTTGGKLIGFGNSQSGASSQYDRHLYLTDRGTLIFGVYSGTYYTVESPAAYTDGAWHLATATLSSSGMALYVDGTLVGSANQAAAENARGYWRIGYDAVSVSWASTPTSKYYRGDLDDTTVLDVASTPAEVSARYSAGR